MSLQEQNTHLGLFERARKSIPAGVHSNTRARQPHPLYFSRAQGAWAWDIEGCRWLDCVMGNGAHILGHGHPTVIQAVKAQLETGLDAGLESELSVRVAEKFLKLVPTADLVRFANTGTEAVMHALRIARAATGKPSVAKMEGSYHGWYDPVFVSTWAPLELAGPVDEPAPVPGTNGLDPDAVQNTVVLPFNDVEKSEVLLRKNADRLAAVILEPVMIDIGYVAATQEYLTELRRITRELDIVLIFDELLTGFRLAVGGAQAYYGVTPDLSVFGKAISNGQVVAAVAGKAAFMNRSAPGANNTTFVGTFNGHNVALAAVDATLDLLADGSVITRLEQATERIAESFASTAASLGIHAHVQGGGGHFQWYFADKPIRNYRDAATVDRSLYAQFTRALAHRGVLTMTNPLGHHALSVAHGDDELDFLENAVKAALEDIAR